MRDVLFQFQEDALRNLHNKINKAHLMWSDSDPQVISFSAPTGAGKTIIQADGTSSAMASCPSTVG